MDAVKKGMDLNEYQFKYFCKSTLSIAKTVSFNDGISVMKIEKYHLGKDFGLTFLFTTTAKNNIEARQNALERLMNTIEVISFSTDIPISAPQLIYLLRASRGNKRVVLQMETEYQEYNNSLSQNNWDSVSKLSEIQVIGLKRAIKYYSISLASQNFLDKFFFLWLSLENLAGFKVIVSRCSSCNEELICKECSKTSSHPSCDKQMLEDFFRKYDIKNFKDIYKIRQLIFHGKRALKMDELVLLKFNFFHLFSSSLRKEILNRANIDIPLSNYLWKTRKDKLYLCVFESKQPTKKFITDFPTIDEINKGREDIKLEDLSIYEW